MLRKSYTSLRGVFSDIAQRKSDAARSRQSGGDSTAEAPGDVYAAACAEIAAAFTGAGYRYSKSGPHLTRKEGDFCFRVSFQSSRHNIPGQHVSLSVAANVRSKKIGEWRQRQPIVRRSDDWVAGGLIHLLGTGLTYVAWDLADAAQRPATIADVVSFIRSVAVPYFARFEDVQKLVTELEAADVPAVDIGDAVEFALCFSGEVSAKKILARFVRERPNLGEAILEAERKIKEEGFKKHYLTAYADQVAFLRSAYRLSE